MADKTDEPFFKAKLGDKTYELPKLTLIETVILKKKFGIKGFETLDPNDPETLLGYLYLCVRREKPSATDAEIMAEVGDIDILDLMEDDEDEPETEDVEPDPTPDTPPSSKPPARAKAKAKTAGA